MRQDNRLPRVMHALLHLQEIDGPVTSGRIAEMLGTNPAVVRRTMSGLREAGLVHSAKGHGGGWQLTRPLSEISLLEVYEALGTPSIFAIAVADENAHCLLEQSANAATSAALEEARMSFRKHLAAVTMADLAADARAAGRPS